MPLQETFNLIHPLLNGFTIGKHMNNQSFYIESNKFFLISLGSNSSLEDCLKTDVDIGGTYFVVEEKLY